MSQQPTAARLNLRACAAQVLYTILEQGKSARDCLPAMQQRVNPRDRAWLQEMVYGVLRELPLLQYWLRDMLEKPLKKQTKVVEHLIMLGFYQLAFSRVSAHAAVSETVAACQSLKAGQLKGLVNAILRNFERQNKARDLPADPQIRSGLPKWLYRRLAQAYPQQLDDICQQMAQRPPIWLRVNQRKTSLPDYCQQLDKADIQYHRSEQHPWGLVLTKGLDITTLPGYAQGLFSVQDGAAQLAAPLLDPQPGERLLDCCAAPGGKTAHLLEYQPQLGHCIALDNAPDRLARVEENLARLGLSAQLLCGDASTPESWWDKQLFDRILLDAPCSATGVIRKHPDIRWLRKNQDIEALVALQAQILDHIWTLLKPGGTLLYATCSILPQENTQQVAAFLQRTGDASLRPISATENEVDCGWQILPGQQQMDGFYYARLLKSER